MKKRMIIYGLLGFAVFFVAIMNYILISVSTMDRQAKTVGVHKCNGASTGDIFGMFLVETGIIVLMSILVSALIIFNTRDLIEDLLSVKVTSLFTWDTLWVPLLTIFVLFVVAGVLPGRLFSRIPVTQVFRRYTDGKKGWKRSLLFVQFTGVSFVLGVLLISWLQYSHLLNMDMGIRTPGLAAAQTWLQPEEAEHMADNIRRQPMVESVARSANNVIGEYWTRGLVNNSGERISTLNYNICSPNYVETMGIEIIEGTDFKNDGDVLVNEEVVRLMKWTDGAVGKRLNDFERSGAIVGVFRNIRNYTFIAWQCPIALIREQFGNCFNVRLKMPYDENKKRLNAYMEQTYPKVSMEFVFVDDMLRDNYQDIYRFRNSVWITSGFILIIVIMGLIGYVNDETRRRSKEIAIRKVNGAEASSVLKLLSKDIFWTSLPSVLIGSVVAYLMGKKWLEQYTEQIDLNILWFIAVAAVVLIVVLLTVILKAWYIANENPVKSIKSE